jgi:cytochrome c oxidase assembly protein subunit 15
MQASIKRSTVWLNRFAWLTALTTLFLVCSGGMVTSQNAGLAVPDWPTTFGYNMFLFPVSKWIGGIFFEHTHRLIASFVGLLTIILAVWLWRSESREPVRNLGLIAVAAVILQGILGGLRVTMLRDQIGIFHACLAQAFLALLVLIALVTTDLWRSNFVLGSSVEHTSAGRIPPRVSRKMRPIAVMTTATSVAIYLQLALGATMRHQHRDLAILDFPTANGAWIPDTSEKLLAGINRWRDTHGFSDVTAFQIWLQMGHRLLALLIAIAILLIWLRVWRDARDIIMIRRLSGLWLALVIGQIILGGWVIWTNKAADVATAHVALGAVMLSLGVSISALCWRLSHHQSVERACIPMQTKEAAVG